ncbi:cellulose binding domain-containing protein [Phytohabitans sp. LJ34]|uniref:cellulose binding domain-containing protein n=1 Tax=Phytohabitans sp. LJ34 TaxID=3452217 RepID=UPI003F89A13F
MHARTYRRALAMLLPALFTLTATTVAATPAQAAPPCSVTYVGGGWNATPEFPAGFQGTFTVTNNATRKMFGWRIETHFQTGAEVTGHWNSELLLDADPVYVFGNASYNGELVRGQSIQFGVTGRKSADNISNSPYSAVCAPLY